MRAIFTIVCLVLLSSCTFSRKDNIETIVKTWIGKEIEGGLDSILQQNNLHKNQKNFLILSYVDSLGCISCKLQLNNWKRLNIELDSLDKQSVSVIFIVHPSAKKDIYHLLNAHGYSPSLCYIDEKNLLQRKNNFPDRTEYQTFLLDNHFKILAIGNPIQNPKVKELYLKIIRGEQAGQEAGGNGQMMTRISIDKTTVSMGTFNWQDEQKACFKLKNTGNNLLVIEQVNTSCGCTTVEYSQEPVAPGRELTLTVTYKAEQPGHFDKTITVYCNTEDSPVVLRISGNAI